MPTWKEVRLLMFNGANILKQGLEKNNILESENKEIASEIVKLFSQKNLTIGRARQILELVILNFDNCKITYK